MVKRGFLMLALLLGAAACDNDSPTAPADPNIVVFTAQLSAANEVPPIDDVEKDARGNVRITVNLTRDAANNITGATYNFVVNLNSFPTDSVWTLAHIHEGAAGVAGPVRVNTGLSTTGGPAPIPLTSGTISNQTFSNATANANLDPVATINSMIANPSGWYFNAHTTRHGGGAVRGQLVKQ
jgi:hypothetical protein